MRTLLFDIDGTLLLTQRAGASALVRAMHEEFAFLDFPIDGISFGGRTDCSLMHELLTVAEIEPCETNRQRLRQRYAAILQQSLPETPGHVLPGVMELLGQLTQIPAIALAVMTGNFPETARMKLEVFQLNRFFKWIVGGDLDVDRRDLAKRAQVFLTEQFGQTPDEVLVIGDTPADVFCAQAIGAKCLAVCTGAATRQQLEQAKPDRIVDDLTDTAVLDFLTR
ncbi:HAD family hydrolase [Rhodopirellula sp. MGV]|uniref:HAD family hydrolase n=1 Tax=Rhodopirellula sp. MGV TaxID=2023130 RepID=UPI000B9738DF|nr:HAD family hydrolase [Rhodopirellula sp. MGV]OYP34449.1 hypothetical protein CGZ80_15505 [Rhodopirellula sp. MGV]PNY37376.1 HAD family hydrolase [Rhodopirellula baltica]